MKAINDIKGEMMHMKFVLKVLEDATNGKEFIVNEIYDKPYGYIMSGALASALVRRGLLEVVGTRPSSYKADAWVHGKVREVVVPCEVKVYKLIHDYEWYKNVMIKTLTDSVMSV